ncbi:MAG: poly(A) polymerase [Kiritimatiellae bacterium]|nr:poly(A) polymerase [Kiritimatiellia bacterium]
MSFIERLLGAKPTISARDVDPDALSVLHRLQSHGFTAYLVGGGVRDLLLGRTPKDFDVATDARPNQIKKLFRNAYVIGRRFRLVLIRFGEKQIETATFRRDPEADDDAAAADRPAGHELYQESDNAFGTPEEDALRRDFTANALFWDPATGEIIDYTGGLKDLRRKVLRCIGDPDVRFREDPVRMLRAVRLGSRLGFTIHSASLAAIRRYGSEIAAASKPRLFEEILRLFTFAKSREAFGRLHETGLMRELLPAVADYVERTGGAKSPLWAYLSALDAVAPDLDTEHRESPRYVQENALRLATLLAPLLRERLRASGASAAEVAERLVGGVVVAPYMTQGWRVPRALCYDLERILVSLADYPKRPLRWRRTSFSRPWFFTALTLWGIAADAERDRASEPALALWRAQFAEWAAGPHPPRRGTYVPTDPDKAGTRGFPGDVPEDRDSLFPGDRLRGRRSAAPAPATSIN